MFCSGIYVRLCVWTAFTPLPFFASKLDEATPAKVVSYNQLDQGKNPEYSVFLGGCNGIQCCTQINPLPLSWRI